MVQRMKNTPDYKKIYRDMIALKYPDKEQLCQPILSKKQIQIMDVIRLDEILSEKTDTEQVRNNQKLKAYDLKAIREILQFQKESGFNNRQLAAHFRLSRNTVSRWKRMVENKS